MAKKMSRNKDRPSAKLYKAENRAAKNKEKKLTKHIITHPNDKQSVDKPIVSYAKRTKK
jgi:hypothetical protein